MTQQIYGIDLGTTYSCVSLDPEHGRSIVLDNIEGQHTTPSVVFFEDDGTVVVGESARSSAKIHPNQYVSMIKRKMGKVDERVTVLGRTYTPQEISAFILKKIVSDASSIGGDHVTDVVITCPAYFDLNARRATMQAGEIAGLKVWGVLPEPMAAAIAYGVDRQSDQTVLVYDLGGGTFDVSLVTIRSNEISAVAIGGDNTLGGYEWDEIIATHFARKFEETTGISATAFLADGEGHNTLFESAERLKKMLTSKRTVRDSLTFRGERAVIDLSRETFDKLTGHLITRTIDLTHDVLQRGSNKGYDTVDRILLVGGSTYMPQVKDRLSQEFDFPIELHDPNLAVAKGAAIYATKHKIEQDLKNFLRDSKGQVVQDVSLLDPETIMEAAWMLAPITGISPQKIASRATTTVSNVTSRSFGVLAYEFGTDIQRVTNLVVVNDTIPAEASHHFRTRVPNSTNVSIKIYQSNQQLPSTEAYDPALCDPKEPIGTTLLEFSRPLPAASRFRVDFHLDGDGLLTVNAWDLTTNGHVNAQFHTSAVMSELELAIATRHIGTVEVH